MKMMLQKDADIPLIIDLRDTRLRESKRLLATPQTTGHVRRPLHRVG